MEGKSLASFESYQNNRFFKLGGKIGDVMILSGMWLLCSLPVVTLGASTAALYYGTIKCLRCREEHPARLFWHSFKDNLKQGILLTLLYLGYSALVAIDIYAARHGIGGFKLPPFYEKVAYVLVLPVAFTIAYIFPYISRFENSGKNALKNSFLLSALHIDHLLAILVLAAAAIALGYLFPPAALLTPCLAALLSSMMIEKDFSKAHENYEVASAPHEGDEPEAADALPEAAADEETAAEEDAAESYEPYEWEDQDDPDDTDDDDGDSPSDEPWQYTENEDDGDNPSDEPWQYSEKAVEIENETEGADDDEGSDPGDH